MPFTSGPQPRIAIIGSGISGLGAAFALKDSADVTVYEKRSRLGGHACTVDIDYDGTSLAVDAGFIVCNNINYPNLLKLFDTIGVGLIDSDMSFAVSNPNGLEWSSDPRGWLAWKRNAISPRFLSMVGQMMRFNKLGRHAHATGTLPDISLGAWLDLHNFPESFRRDYLLPMGAAIWSSPEDEMLNYPVTSFISFFDNHHLMHTDRPTWRTLKGGSRTYVDRLDAILGDRIKASVSIASVAPGSDGRPLILFDDGTVESFDSVIMASHSDQSHALLDETYTAQRIALSHCRYGSNKVFVHRDPDLMPRRKAAWASWNVMRDQTEDRVCVSYWMNRLQKLPDEKPVFVTLNPATPPKEDLTFLQVDFDHPLFNGEAQRGRTLVNSLQGENGIWFAGAWLGDGFHESGLKSGLAVARALGGQVPWDMVDVPELRPAETSQLAALQTRLSTQ